MEDMAEEKLTEPADTVVVEDPPKLETTSTETKETGKPFKFGFSGSSSATDFSKVFSLGAPPSDSADGKDSKSFTFGSNTSLPPVESKEPPKSFTFGQASAKQDYTWTPDKPIKFDTPPSTKSSTFTFGQSSSAQPFKFGGLSTPIPPVPKFGAFGGTPPSAFGAFGGKNVSFSPPNLGFSFGGTKPELKPEQKPEEASVIEKTEDADGGGDAEDEVPVVSSEVDASGEEDEDTIFSERAKLIQRLSNAEYQADIDKRVNAGGKPEDVKQDRDYGVGVVRVNIHKQTGKGRILFRLEGSGRVVLVDPPLHVVDF
jgi:hypothetical protein